MANHRRSPVVGFSASRTGCWCYESQFGTGITAVTIVITLTLGVPLLGYMVGRFGRRIVHSGTGGPSFLERGDGMRCNEPKRAALAYLGRGDGEESGAGYHSRSPGAGRWRQDRRLLGARRRADKSPHARLEGVRLAPPSVVQRAFDFEASRLSASERFLRERFEGSPGSTNQRSQLRRYRRDIAGASRLDRSISGDGRTSDFKFIQRSFSVHATFIPYHIDASG